MVHVELLYYTPNPQRAIATAARLCYAPIGAAELMEDMTESQEERVLKTVLGGGHFSTLEHASYTFAVEGVSRALTHQLVRHRMASYNQQSQRYVKYSSGFEFIKPDSIAQTPDANALFDATMQAINDAYLALLEQGIPAEDARYVLPNACETKIVVTMNARELKHFFNVRCCNRAQWEIRELAWKMLELVQPTAPLVFADCGPECVRSGCTEGKMTCGSPYPKAQRV